ncbi:SusC/RagA family TonB-linked outer membrane protein [Carboxylicivirga marina]|uniref:TonB-dependent receptor n=1 Tax=Carboxylicivirga marina TaxID=2800988 RepID=A0ABS1HFY3_9BACT|nr:TonB-dependent receptor [Carboxylicivirga marina]MBK3516208.1 TonB-dependent receptor [Carboxylicivirga marina]
MKKFLMLLLFLVPISLMAQELSITGKVLDKETNEPLPGVTVYIKGTTNGTISGNSGEFNIRVKKADVLVFSFIGMKTKEVVVGDETNLTIHIEPEISELDEVVVSVGYFNVKKSDLTGSVAQVTSHQMEKVRTNSVERMLQGQVAGVVVNENSEPGGGVSISIRGTNSMLGGTQPLYVVDGIPIDPIQDAQGNSNSGQSQSSLSFLNPNDIEKMEVLKDAAATAIYGARGANGVVVITTKQADGKAGRDQLSVTADFAMSELNQQIDVLNGPQFEGYMNQRTINQLYIDITNPSRDGMVFDGTQDLTPENFEELDGYTMPYPTSIGINTNWQDEVYRKAYSKMFNVAYRGGDQNSNLSVSLGLSDNQGVIINTDYKRATFNMNGMRKAFDKKVSVFTKTNASYGKGRASSVGNGQMYQDRSVVSNALRFQPIFDMLEPGQDDDVYAELNEGQILSNPYTLAKYVEDDKTAITFNQALSVVGKITPHLSATAKGAFNYQKSLRDSYYPTFTTRGRRNNGEATQSYNQNIKTYAEGNLHYVRKFGQHKLDAIVVGTYEVNNIRATFNKAYGYGSDITSYYTFESATDIVVPVTRFTRVGLLSGLFRVGYNYKGKYYVDVNARMDSSSKFAENKKSAFFPSVALAWRASEEPFLKGVESISNLKLRASYGKTGSNPIAAFQSLGVMSPIRYNFNNKVTVGYFEQNLANPNLTWETTDQYNAGVDFSMFNSRLNLTFDAYYKLTHDLLQLVNLPASNGYATKVDNFGEVENKGIELTLGGDIIRNKDWQWNILGTFSVNRNQLVKLNSNLEYQLGPAVGYDKTYPSMFMEGQPLGIFWGAETDGVYANWDEAAASGINDAAAGEIKYINHSVDYDENGEPLDVQTINFDDYVQIGDPNPDFTASINNSLSFRNWDLSILFTGQKGGDILWVDSWPLNALKKSTNVATDAYNDSWKAPLIVTPVYDEVLEDYTYEVAYNPAVGQTTGVTNPAAATDGGQRAIVSDRQIYDGSFIKLKNVNIGYTFRFKSKKSLRLYASGQNLFTWTNYPGYDPEVQAFNKDPQRRSIDFGAFPGTRNYVFGVKLDF